MIRISPRARNYIRNRASDLLGDWCIIRRVQEAVLDPDTNEYSTPEGELIYEGPCRLWESSAAMSVSLGDEETGISQTYLSLPWDIDPVPEMNDVAVLTSSIGDNTIEGVTVVLGKPARGGNLRATRRFAAKVQESTKKEW